LADRIQQKQTQIFMQCFITVRSLIFDMQDLIKPYSACNPDDSMDSGIFILHRAFAIL
jgi:hypothetical protein